MIDLKELEQTLLQMTPDQKVYGVVKKSLTAIDHWKNKNRGSNRSKQALSKTRFTPLSTVQGKPQQVKAENEHADWGI